MISSEVKAKAIKQLGQSKNDTGSTAVQVGVISSRIDELTDHVKTHPKDNHSREGLLRLVGQRKRLLKYLRGKDYAGYLSLVKKLKLRG